jgi:hypothetical protein
MRYGYGRNEGTATGYANKHFDGNLRNKYKATEPCQVTMCLLDRRHEFCQRFEK